MQFLAFSGLMLWVIPGIVLEQTGDTWKTVLERPWWAQVLLLSLAAFLAVPALSAVQEFHCRGQGTPVPLDPPRRLVTSGPYAYLANPMEWSMTLLFMLWGFWTGSVWVGMAAVTVLTASAGMAGWNEARDLRERFGETWAAYHREVRSWRPRRRPRLAAPARLYVAQSCTQCRALGAWLQRRAPVGLEILPAETHPGRALVRPTYEAPAWSESGTRALARALEHLNFGWAWAGWILRLPGLAPVIQWLVDLSGGGPRSVPARDSENGN